MSFIRNKKKGSVMKIENSNSLGSSYQIGKNEKDYNKELQKIIAQKAVDATDGASMQIYDSLQSEVDTYSQGIKNANDAIGYLQIANGSAQSLTDGGMRLGELSAQYNSAALNDSQKDIIKDEAGKIKESMSQSVSSASFNGKNIFSGGEASFYTGGGYQSFTLTAPNIKNLDVTNQDSVLAFQKELGSLKSTIGSSINAISSSIDANMGAMTAMASAKSQIGDTDNAKAITDMKSADIRLNFATMSQAHNSQYLASKVESLLR
jgi:flagellin